MLCHDPLKPFNGAVMNRAYRIVLTLIVIALGCSVPTSIALASGGVVGGMVSSGSGIDSGLVAYWSFDDGTATDNSGNGHDGVLYGGPTFEPGACGMAVRFDGADDYIRVPNSPALQGLQRMTVSYWIKYYHPSFVNVAGNSIGNGSDDKPREPGFYTYTGSTEISHFLGLQPNGRGIRLPYDATVPLDQQEFSFITFVVSDDSLKAYRNGCLYRAISRDGWPIGRNWDWFIGWSGDLSGDGKYLEGYMDEIRIHDRPLSDGEIFALYTACGGRPVGGSYSDHEICAGDSVRLSGTVDGGTKPYTYSWSPALGLDAANIASPVASPAVTTVYNVTITDAIGCSTVETVTVKVNDCSDLTADYVFYLPSLCPGATRRTHVMFRSNGFNDTIVGVSFVGPDRTAYSLDTVLPITLYPSRDTRIPVVHRWLAAGTHKAVMQLKTSHGLTHTVLLISETGNSDEPTFDLDVVYIGKRSEPFDTCLTVKNLHDVGIRVEDTAWISSGRTRLLSPSMPFEIPPKGSAQICLRIDGVAGINDTVIFGGQTLVANCPMCVGHVLTIDRTSPVPGPKTADVGTLAVPDVGADGPVVRPNPAKGEVTVSCLLERPARLRLSIVDALGREVAVLLDERCAAGTATMSFDISDLPAGLYLVRSETGGATRDRILSVVK